MLVMSQGRAILSLFSQSKGILRLLWSGKKIKLAILRTYPDVLSKCPSGLSAQFLMLDPIHHKTIQTWMDLETLIQSEVSQKEKNKYHILTHICGT